MKIYIKQKFTEWGVNFYWSIKQWPGRSILKLDKGGINTEAIKLR